MSAPTVPEVLRRAAQIIDQRGLHKGWYVADDGGAVCALGACAVAAGLDVAPLGSDEIPEPMGPADAYALWRTAWNVLANSLPANENWLGIDDWNDSPARTAEQVRAALLAAAEKATQVAPDAA